MMARKRLDREYTTRYFTVVNNDGDAEVFCRIFYHRQKAETKTGIKGLADDWDAASGRFDESKPYNVYVNRQIDSFEEEIYTAYVKVKDAGYGMTAQKIKQVYLGNTEALQPSSPLLRDYFEGFVDRIKTLTEDYTIGTIQHYETASSYLGKFLSASGQPSLKLNEIRRKHIMAFETHLLTTVKTWDGKPIQRVTANKYLSKLRKVINHAEGEELITVNPYRGFKMQRPKPKNKFLTRDEIAKIEGHDLAGNESLNRIRLLFLFSVYTGLRFSDAIKLKRSTIEKGSDGIHYIVRERQQKTDSTLWVPMLDRAVRIYKEFEEKIPENEYVLPRISNQKLNAQLKVIAGIVGLRVNLTHHVARHTFATTVLFEAGVDLKTTSMFMGHNSIKSTEVYAKVTPVRMNDVIRDVNRKHMNAA